MGRPPDPHPTCRARKAVKNDLRRAQRTLEASLRSNLYNKLSAVNNRTDPIFYTMIKHQRQTKQTTGSSLRVDDQIISDTSETLEAWAAYFENLGTPANKPNFDADFHEFCLQENHILDIICASHHSDATQTTQQVTTKEVSKAIAIDSTIRRQPTALVCQRNTSRKQDHLLYRSLLICSLPSLRRVTSQSQSNRD